jgi:hypothetical protein
MRPNNRRELEVACEILDDEGIAAAAEAYAAIAAPKEDASASAKN